jgi:hypothetical protein
MNLRTSVQIIPLLVAYCLASDVDVISINSLGNDAFAKKKQEIEQLLSKGNLTKPEKKDLEKLRARAIEVATLNEECKSLDTSRVPNKKCLSFYRIELPKFEEELGRVTGNLYLSPLKMVKGLQDRMQQIDVCVDAMKAFLDPLQKAQNLIESPVKEIAILEPINRDTAEFNYKFTVGLDRNRLNILDTIVQRWEQSCGDIVKHPVEYRFAPYFLSRLKEVYNTKGLIWNIGDSRDRIYSNIYVHYLFRYEIDGNQLFSGNANALKPSVSIQSRGYARLSTDGPKTYEGKLILPVKSNGKGIIAQWDLSELKSYTDARDSQTYHIVKIGNQTWMAQNLNFQAEGSWCFNNDSLNCQHYGRLYDWNTANTVCPSDWHLPTNEEWNEHNATRREYGIFGFSADDAGYRDDDGDWSGLGSDAFFWSANGNTDYGRSYANYYDDGLNKQNMERTHGLSVRCLQN